MDDPLPADPDELADEEDDYPDEPGGFAAGPGEFAGGPRTYTGRHGNFADSRSDLTNGHGDFAAGSAEFGAGSGDFAAGSRDFVAGSGEFGAGAGDFAAGSAEFGAGSGDFAAGSRDFVAGSGEFVAGSAEFGAGSGDFAAGSGEFAGSADDFADGAPGIGGSAALDYLDGSYTPPAAAGPSSGRPNGFAIAAFVLGAIGGTILSFVLAIIALRQIRETGQHGRGLAIAGLVFSVFWAAVLAGYLLLYNPAPAKPPASVGSSSPSGASSGASAPSASPTGSGGTTGPGGTGKRAANVFALRVGDCFQNPPGDQSVLGITYITVVPCTTLHNAQVFVEFNAVGTKYPGAAALGHQADRGCHARLGGRLVNSKITSTMTLRFLYPLASSWSSGHKTISCIIVDAKPDLKDSLLR